MKKIGTILLLCTLMLIPITAQNFNYSSLALDFSANLFPSPMDQALSVSDLGFGPGFADLEHNYLFGGLANLTFQDAENSGSEIAAPAILGFFSEGKSPWSFVTGLDFTTVSGEDNGGTTSTYGAATTVTSGTTDTDYPVLTDQTVTENSARLFEDMDVQFQYLTEFGDIISGLYFNIVMDKEAAAVDNYTETVTTYYDDSAVPGTDIPVIASDYVETTTATNKNSTGSAPTILEFIVAAPFYLADKKMSHSGNLSFMSHTEDSSTSLAETLTIPATNSTDVASATYDDDSTTDKTSLMTIGLDYGLMMKSFLSKHKESRFNASASIDVSLTGATYVFTDIDQDYSSLAGALVSTETRAENTVTDSISSNVGFDIELEGSETIYHEFGDMIIMGMNPTLLVGYEKRYSLGALTSTTEVDKVDGDADGAFTLAADTITTTTTTYTNTASDGTDIDYHDIVTVQFSLPTAIKFHPEDWICGFVLSNTPTISFENNVTTTKTAVNQETVVVEDGAGTLTSTTVTNANTSVTSSSVTRTWDISNDTTIGAEFYLPEDIVLMIDINGNLFEPETFTIQAIVPTDFLFD